MSIIKLGSDEYYMMIFRALQLVFYLPLFNTVMPAKIIIFI